MYDKEKINMRIRGQKQVIKCILPLVFDLLSLDLTISYSDVIGLTM